MFMGAFYFPTLFDQIDGLQPTVIKLRRNKSGDGIAEDFTMLNLDHPGFSSLVLEILRHMQ